MGGGDGEQPDEAPCAPRSPAAPGRPVEEAAAAGEDGAAQERPPSPPPSCLCAFSFFTVLPCSIRVKQHCTGL